MSVVERVRRTLRLHDLLPTGTVAMAAVSGGSDSVALLHVLLELERSEGFRLGALAHVHHGLRGEEADRDEAFCRDLAARLGLELVVERVDAGGVARALRRSVEDVARELRYAALERSADRVGATAIAVGHTLDDQAETVLLKVVRGAGLRGLGGIHPRRGRAVRPLLDCRRADLRAWLHARDLGFVDDSTNEDPCHARNRLRRDVMPVLREACGPSVDAALARLADVARTEEAFLAELSDAAAAEVVHVSGQAVRIELAGLARQPRALQRRIVLIALQRAGAVHPGFAAVDAVLSLAADGGGADLPGVRADRTAGRVVLRSSAAARAWAAAVQPFRYRLPVPGRVRLPECGRALEASTVPGPAPAGVETVVLDGPGVAAGLFVRSWQPGDWLRPVGLGGRKKVQDLFVDRKVPRADRGRVPLVVTADDRVIWVPGHALDERYRAASPTGDVVVLTMTELGGPE